MVPQERKDDKYNRNDEAAQTKDKQGCMDNGEHSIFSRQRATDDPLSIEINIQARYPDDGSKFFSQPRSIFFAKLHYEGDIFPLMGGSPNKCGSKAHQCWRDGGYGGQE